MFKVGDRVESSEVSSPFPKFKNGLVERVASWGVPSRDNLTILTEFGMVALLSKEVDFITVEILDV